METSSEFKSNTGHCGQRVKSGCYKRRHPRKTDKNSGNVIEMVRYDRLLTESAKK
jgi:hypothetical protein